MNKWKALYNNICIAILYVYVNKYPERGKGGREREPHTMYYVNVHVPLVLPKLPTMIIM